MGRGRVKAKCVGGARPIDAKVHGRCETGARIEENSLRDAFMMKVCFRSGVGTNYLVERVQMEVVEHHDNAITNEPCRIHGK